MDKAAKQCFEAIISQAKRPLFVGVGGDSGSGKSYLVSLIVEHLKAHSLSYSVINHDEFLISRADREPMKTKFYDKGKFQGRSHWEVLENMFRLDEYKRVIEELKSGSETTFNPYSRKTGTILHEKRTIKQSDFYIFDTSMMLDNMDFVIVVDVTQDNIIQRKLVRDSDIRTPQQITEMHNKVQGYYWLDRGKPTSPDILVDNNDFQNVHVLIRQR